MGKKIPQILAVTMLLANVAIPQITPANQAPLPDFSGAVGWLNTAPLDRKALRGKVVLVNFWTYSCINSLRELPYLKAWAAKYADAGLVVIGVHTPEFEFEKQRANVQWAVGQYQLHYPVAIDTDYRIWGSFQNTYWPANYFVDAKGRIRYYNFGEGAYVESERVLQQLLKENGATIRDVNPVAISWSDIEAPPSPDVQSPETYVGYRQGERFSSPVRLARDSRKAYALPFALSLNHWGLVGPWNVGAEHASLEGASGKIAFRFHSRDLHLVLIPAKSGESIRFKLTLDSAAPGEDSGADASADGSGIVREPRLYQLIRQKGRIQDRTFEIEFLDPGVQAFAFTFG